MTTRHSIQLAILTLLLLASAAQSAESLSVLLQKGIYAEETEGNLDAAIKIYEGIVKEGEANRSLVAQAQYRLGVCELKRGKREDATAAFRKLIDQFSDAAELVPKAREQLIQLGQFAATVAVRQVLSGKEALSTSVSSDGRLLALIDWEETGNLVVRDLVTGRNRRLTEHASWKEPVQYAETCALSRDGKLVAYSWFSELTNSWSYGLHIVNVEDGKTRTLLAQQTDRWIGVGDWSPDGKWIAAFEYQWAGKPTGGTLTNLAGAVLLVHAEDGSVRKLAALRPSIMVSDLRFSPDGRYLAYEASSGRFPVFDQSSSNDIYVLDVQSGTAKRILEHFANEQFVGWAPRGSEILFSSERRGTTDLWAVPVENGEAKGPPMLLKADLGKVRPIGLTQNGSFFFSKDSSYAEVRHARMDFATGKLLKPVETLPIRSTGRIIDFRQAFTRLGTEHDGRYLMLLGSHARADEFLSIFDLQTRRQWMLDSLTNFSQYNTPFWVWDQSALVIKGVHKKTGNGVYLIDPTNGSVALAASETPGYTLQYPHAQDANPIITVEINNTNRNRFLVTCHDLKDLSTRKWEFELPERHSRPQTVVFEEKSVFYYQRPMNPQQEPWVARRLNFETGQAFELFKSKYPISLVSRCAHYHGDRKGVIVSRKNQDGQTELVHLTEYPDALHETLTITLPMGIDAVGGNSRYFVFRKPFSSSTQSGFEVWAGSNETGEMLKTELVLPPEAGGLAATMHDVFFLVRKSNVPELWVMENFLPPVAAKN